MLRAIILWKKWHTKNVLTFMDNMKGVKRMLDFTWEVFSQTGNVELYLLFKEIEGQGEELKPETASQGESEYLSGSQIQI